MTCIGNSGPLPEPVAKVVRETDVVAAAVLSGNRNFEGRVDPGLQDELPRVAAARRRVRARRPRRRRPGDRAARPRPERPARSTCATSGRRAPRSRGRLARRWTRPTSRGATPRRSTATRAGVTCRRRRATSTPGTPTRPTFRSRRSSPTSTPTPAPAADVLRRARPRAARRLDHDRPHLAGRQHRDRPARPRAT